jgi:hypothetical protein
MTSVQRREQCQILRRGNLITNNEAPQGSAVIAKDQNTFLVAAPAPT